jgi:hypothetical protein
MFGFKRRKILRKAISLTYPFAATHGTSARNWEGKPVSVGHEDARSFCAVGYVWKACDLCGYHFGETTKILRRIEDKNGIDQDLGLYFDLSKGTAEDARKLFEKAL